MGNLFLIMSDYDYYGDERPPPPMDGEDGMNGRDGMDGKDGMDGQNGMDGKDGKDYEEKGGKKTQVMMAFALVPLGDLFTYYKINDFNTAATSEWTLAANVSLAAGVLKFVSIGASMVVKSKALMMVPTARTASPTASTTAPLPRVVMTSTTITTEHKHFAPVLFLSL